MDTLKKTIIEKISTKELVMKPHWQFFVQTGVMIFGVVLAFLIIVGVGSFVLFVIRSTGALYASDFGIPGMVAFFFALPWFLIALIFALIFLLELLLQKFALSYKKPLIYSLGTVVVLLVFGSVVLFNTHIHEKFQERAMHGNLPLLGSAYRTFSEDQSPSISMGVITELRDTGFIMEDFRKGTLTVTRTLTTKIAPTLSLQVGERVVVFGPREGDQVSAVGITIPRRGDGPFSSSSRMPR